MKIRIIGFALLLLPHAVPVRAQTTAAIDTAAADTTASVHRAIVDSIAMRVPRTPKAVVHNETYFTMVKVHRDVSYALIPLFAVQYAMGRRLIQGNAPTWVRTTHVVGFHVLGAMVFTNTVSGVFQAVETRHEKEDRTRRLVHEALMLAADASFAYTASIAHDAKKLGIEAKRKHEHAALVSIGLTTAGAVVMWLR